MRRFAPRKAAWRMDWQVRLSKERANHSFQQADVAVSLTGVAASAERREGTAPTSRPRRAVALDSFVIVKEGGIMRCTRCGKVAGETDKFCAECGMFLRDAHVDQRLLLALTHEREGRFREAKQELERLLAIEANHVLANHLMGNLLFHQGALDLAIERYKRAIAGAPNFILCSYDLGVAQYHRGNMPEAIASFQRCLEIDGHYNAAHYRLAICLFHAGELDRALQHFEQCCLLTPEYLMAHYHIGVIHERQGDSEKASREFQRNVADGVGEVSSLFHLAKIRLSHGDDAGAKELLESAREFAKARLNSV